MEFKRLFRLGSFILVGIYSLVEVVMKIFLVHTYQTIQPLRLDFSSISTISNDSSPILKNGFKPATTLTWIGLGGVVQLFILLKFLLCKKKASGCPFSWRLQLLLIGAAFCLLSPVAMNIYCAHLIYRNHANVDEDVDK